MDNSILSQEIQYLPGVGPKRAAILASEMNILTFRDLLYHFPYRYIDRSKFYTIKEINPDLPYIQLKGEIISVKLSGLPRNQRLTAVFADDTGSIELVWFKGIKWIQSNLKRGVTYIVFGKPTLFNRVINIVHPEIEVPAKTDMPVSGSLQGLYNTTEKMKNHFLHSKAIQKLQKMVLQKVQGYIEETLPDYLLRNLHLLPLSQALLHIHFPAGVTMLRKAEYRLKFEELFYIQLGLLQSRVHKKAIAKSYSFPMIGTYFNFFYKNNLRFELTGAQKKVIKEIRKDVNTGFQMNRLLQGDVGSGKTLVAIMAMLMALDNGYQACLMAPTEILAAQHYKTISDFLQGIDVPIRLLMGSTKKAERNDILQQLASNVPMIIIGTHALIEESVIFGRLGFVVIDEQHRFGVAQRARLWEKNPEHPPHILVMTATPIPRTLAMTLYGDLDVSVIDELPPGRQPVKTVHFYDSQRLKVFGFMRQQIASGRQVYVVYPLIKESEKMDYKALEDGYFAIIREFPPPTYHVGILHGKMKAKEKEEAMRLFVSGKSQILVATTVIEVGVDVPNATVMIIESVERFGLSQLHQLRGRVGRGGGQSFCILMSGNKLSTEARLRIGTMLKTTDGFEIAEADLKLRGPGDIEGTQQSGIAFDLKIANLAKDGNILQTARHVAEKIIAEDNDLSKSENTIMAKQLSLRKTHASCWSKIS